MTRKIDASAGIKAARTSGANTAKRASAGPTDGARRSAPVSPQPNAASPLDRAPGRSAEAALLALLAAMGC